MFDQKIEPTREEEEAKAKETMTNEQFAASFKREKVKEILKQMGHEGSLVYNQEIGMGSGGIEGEIDGIHIIIRFGNRSVSLDEQEIPEEAGFCVYDKYVGTIWELLKAEQSDIRKAEQGLQKMKKVREWTENLQLNAKINRLLE